MDGSSAVVGAAEPKYASLQSYYRQSGYAEFNQEHRAGGAFRVRMVYAEQGPHALVDPPLPELHIVGGVRAQGIAKLDFGEGWRERRGVRSGFVDLQPPEQTCCFQIEEPHTVLVASVPIEGVRQILDQVGIREDPFRSLYGTLPGRGGQMSILRSMWDAMRLGGPANDLYVDGCMISLLGGFCGLADATAGWSAPILDDIRLKRAVDYIDAHYAEPIMLSDLAAAASMSVIHFSRAFRKAVGLSPHAFLTQRRLAQAKVLLKTSKLPITEIAFSAGFGSPAHFSTVFSRNMGVTPTAFRTGGG